MKRRIVACIMLICLAFSFAGCANSKEGRIDNLYLVDYFTGYRFFEDGTVIYYEANWYKDKYEAGTGCRPEYWYGTYTLDGASLTIILSGVDTPITGVYTDKRVVIDGKACELKSTPYHEGEEHKSWKELDRVLGLLD